MRIITGKARGFKLTEPKSYDVRPTADRVKESLFNIIGTRMQEARVLDLFAGTGNLGLESWSRGASEIIFVDVSQASLKLVNSNVTKCRAEAACKIIKSDALGAMEKLARQGKVFDFIFCDPPYNKQWVQRVLERLKTCPLLAADGWLVVEHSVHDDIDNSLPSGYQVMRRQKYGETFISLITKN